MSREFTKGTEKKVYAKPSVIDLGSAVEKTLGFPTGRYVEFGGFISWHVARPDSL